MKKELKMTGIRTIIAGVFSLATCAGCNGAVAQGGFNFDEIPGINQEPIVAVDVNSVAIGFVRAMAQEFDPATADMLQGLRGIKLRVYHAAEDNLQFNNFIQNVGERLENSGWQRVMFVQDEAASVRIHMQMTEQAVSGMTVMVFDGTEAVYINIDGTINAADLGKIMAQFNMHGVLQSMPPLPQSSAPRAEPSVNADN
jgi:hypothetical protein